jgi:hypothetical protein
MLRVECPIVSTFVGDLVRRLGIATNIIPPVSAMNGGLYCQ